MNITLVLVAAALALGIMTVIDAKGRSFAGWGIICLALVWIVPLLLTRLSPPA